MITHFSPLHFACFAILFTLVTANAALPPGVEEEMQKKSPEAVTIEVVTVNAFSVKAELSLITVEAKIISVERSLTGLKPGDKIRIKYRTVMEGDPIMTGASLSARLKAGIRYRSYLSATEPSGTYGGAANGISFIEVPAIAPPQ